MQKVMRVLFFNSVLFCFTYVTFACAEGSDFQLWAEADTSYRLNPLWSFETQFCTRFKDDMRKAYHYYYELNFVREYANGWECIPGYRQVYKRVDAKKWKCEAIPHLSIVKKLGILGGELFAKSRIEYRSSGASWLFRQKISYDYPLRSTPFKLIPSIYGEAYLKDGVGLSQYRLFAGLKRGRRRIAELLVGYLLREESLEGTWKKTNIFFLSGLWEF